MTPAERAAFLAQLRPFRRDLLTPVRISDLVELLEVAVACDQAAEAEAVDAFRNQINGPGLS